jgi:hypothetical protein
VASVEKMRMQKATLTMLSSKMVLEIVHAVGAPQRCICTRIRNMTSSSSMIYVKPRKTIGKVILHLRLTSIHIGNKGRASQFTTIREVGTPQMDAKKARNTILSTWTYWCISIINSQFQGLLNTKVRLSMYMDLGTISKNALSGHKLKAMLIQQ